MKKANIVYEAGEKYNQKGLRAVVMDGKYGENTLLTKTYWKHLEDDKYQLNRNSINLFSLEEIRETITVLEQIEEWMMGGRVEVNHKETKQRKIKAKKGN